MFFLHFLYFMDNFYKFLRFYVKFRKVNIPMQAIFAQKPQETNYPKISFTKHINLIK